jgi:signal transduction histidine kinase
MSNPASSLPVTYHSALRDYLAQPSEATLRQAHEIGRAAISAELGVFELIRLHHEALNEGVVSADPAAAVRCAPMLEAFLFEALSPCETAYRGFRRAWELIEQLNTTLAGHNEALALSNVQLEEEISMRQRTEAKLRERTAQVLAAQQEERERISRRLLDEVDRTLTAVNVALAACKRQAASDSELRKKVAEAEALLVSSVEAVHSLARELRPAMLTGSELTPPTSSDPEREPALGVAD